MSVQTQIDRLASAKAAIKTAIEGKGVTVPADTLLSGMASLIEAIAAGGEDVVIGSITPTDNADTAVIGQLSKIGELEFGAVVCAGATADLQKSSCLISAVNMNLDDETSGNVALFGNSYINYDTYGIYTTSRSTSVFIGRYTAGADKSILAGKTYIYVYKEKLA